MEELGLVVTFRELLPNPQNQPGAVVNQSPLPGRTLTRGAEVSIEAAPGTQAVPSLLGLSATDAKQLLKQAGFEVAEAATAAPAGTVDATGAAVGPGTVWSQTPGPGAAPPEDRTVEIRVEPAASTEQPPTGNDSAGLAPPGLSVVPGELSPPRR